MNYTTTTFYKISVIVSLLLSLTNITLYAHSTTEKLDNNFFFTNNINIESQPIDTPIFSIISPAQVTIDEPFCVDLIAEEFDSLIGGTFFMCVDTTFLTFKNIEYIISDTWLIGELLANSGAIIFNFLEIDFSSGTSYPDSTIISTICFTPKKEGVSNVEFCKSDPRPGSDFPPDIITAKEGSTQLPFFGNDGQEIEILPSNKLNITINPTEIKSTCLGAATGSFSFQVSGGTPPYQITWNGENSPLNSPIQSEDGSINIIYLAAGNYTFEVTDSGIGENQQKSGIQGPITIESSNLITATIQKTESTCFESADGTLAVLDVLSNGISQLELSAYSMFWTNQNGDTIPISGNEIVSNLMQGDYQLNIIDSNGCQTVDNYTIFSPAQITVDLEVISASNCLDSNGIITINAITGGTAPYSMEWSNGVTGTINSNLKEGNYEVTITDSNGCFYNELINLECLMSTGLEELDEQQQLLIYPNPTANHLHLQFPETLKPGSNIKLFTLTGQLLQNWSIHKEINTQTINLENLNPGIYLIEIDMEGTIYKEKIIKL